MNSTTNSGAGLSAAQYALAASRAPGGRFLRIEVGDDGVGGAGERLGSGLQGLRDRVEAVGGLLRVASAPGRGTLIRADIPLIARN